MALESLPPLKPLAAPGAPSITGGVGAAVVNAAKKASDFAADPAGTLFGVSAGRLVAIAVGLIVVAAAVFSFKPVRETVVGVSKTAAKAAVVA